MKKETYTLTQLEKILTEVGTSLDKENHIIAVGGFCMLLLKSRVFTADIDFIPSSVELAVPLEYSDVLNHDILNVATLLLDFQTVKKFTHTKLQYGNLVVHLANNEYLLASKIIARQSRQQERDIVDIKYLYPIANWNEMYKVYLTINRGVVESSEDLKAFVETELWLLDEEGL